MNSSSLKPTIIHNAANLPEEILFEGKNDYRNEYMFQHEILALLILSENYLSLNKDYEVRKENINCFSDALYDRIDELLSLFSLKNMVIYLERYDVLGKVIFKRDIRRLKLCPL